MLVARVLLKAFLMPGTVVINHFGISEEEDGGMLRSFVNMCFWGTIFLAIALKIFI
ncbi:MAG: hypothetical protein ABJN26_09625 [Stappiaceae bacterium]